MGPQVQEMVSSSSSMSEELRSRQVAHLRYLTVLEQTKVILHQDWASGVRRRGRGNNDVVVAQVGCSHW